MVLSVCYCPFFVISAWTWFAHSLSFVCTFVVVVCVCLYVVVVGIRRCTAI